MIIVVGSGPAAIAAIHALVRQGHEVTVLDVGRRLEPERQEVVDRMAALDPSEWQGDDLECIKGERSSNREAVHSKKSFGSSFSSESGPSAVDIRWGEGGGFSHSLARGGLSNIWGSALLPYREEDIADWPISLDDLIPHYRAVMGFVPVTAVEDGLEELLPSYSTHSDPLEPSRQAKALLDDLGAREQSLKEDGILFGRSRLAIRAAGDETRRACNYCTLCLSGCPYGLIYDSAQSLEELIEGGKVSYLENHLVEKVEDLGDEVAVTGRHLKDDRPFRFKASRVLLAAGVLPTTKIVLDSLGLLERPIVLKDSQYFVYPLLRFGMVEGVEEERMHTSSQVFVEIDDPRVSEHLVHLQVYGFSSFLLRELKRTFLRWPLRFAGFRRRFLGRLMIVQGFIHSKESGSVELTLREASEGKNALHARSLPSCGALLTALKVGWKLLGQASRLRALPLIPGLKFPKPGSSYHSGGTFPMADLPGEDQTDTLGRLSSMPRVHLVDASILPSIPATSITFSVMANAHRIATAAGRLDHP